MYVVVTGAAGFIGSNLVKALNARGETDIIAVDNLAQADKFHNLVDCDIADYIDKDEFLVRVVNGDFDDDIAAVLHQGACSDTTAADGRYVLRNNFRYSVTLLEHCQDNDVPFLYASSAAVYGAGTVFREERANEPPLNVYGYSKSLFDQYVRRAAARADGAGRGLSLFQRLRSARGAQGADGVGRVSLLRAVSARRPRAAVRGLGRLCRGRAAARLHVASTTSSRPISTSSTIPSARASSTSAPGNARDVQRGRARDDQRLPRGGRRCAARVRRAGRDGTIDYVPFPEARRQVPELYAGRPDAPARRGLLGRPWRRSRRALPRYVESLISST